MHVQKLPKTEMLKSGGIFKVIPRNISIADFTLNQIKFCLFNQKQKILNMSTATVVSDVKIGTHSGTFHCDEVLACFMLRQLPEYENAKVFRSRNDEELNRECDIIVDVGGKFDHKLKLYDHHQKEFQKTLSDVRPDLNVDYKIRLSSAGLIYAFYGERVIERILKKHANVVLSSDNLLLTYKQIYSNFISEIDAIDNGVPMFENSENLPEPLYKISTHLSNRVRHFNPSWEEEGQGGVDIQQQFEKAMQYVGQEFVERVVNIGASWIKAREYVRESLLNAKNIYPTGEILLLTRFCPWKQHLASLEKELGLEGVAKLVIFEENPQSWRIGGVPITPDSFLGRKFLPKEFRGLRDEKLSEAAQIDNLIFVHQTGFMAGAKTKEAAIALAIKSVEWQSNES